jgi:chaperonin GroEL
MVLTTETAVVDKPAEPEGDHGGHGHGHGHGHSHSHGPGF